MEHTTRRRRRAPGWLTAAIGLCALGALHAQPRILAGEPVAVSRDRPGTPHVEPSLAADPADPDLLFGAAVRFPDAGPGSVAESAVAGFRSADGGKTWTRVPFPACRIDPWVSFGNGGELAVACLGEESALIVYRSADGGRAWTGPVHVPAGTAGAADRPVAAIDLSAGPRSGAVYVAAGRSFPASGLQERIYGPAVVRLGDAEPVFLRHDNLTQQPFDATVLSTGALVLFFMDYSTRQGAPLAHRRTWTVASQDGGRTFSPPALVREQLGTEMPWAAAVDRSLLHHDRLYLAVDGAWRRRQGPAESAPPPWGSLFVMISDDAGRTWRTGGTVSDGPPTADAATPAPAVNAGGVVGVAWYDTRRDPAGECFDLYFTASLDGGATFLPSVRITPERSCPRAVAAQRGVASRWPFGGDYSGLAAGADGRFHLFWADSSGGVYQIRTAAVRVSR